MITADWIAADWGTTNLRVWAMQGGTVLDTAQSDAGMGKLARDEFEAALLTLVDPWLDGPTPVIACGMVGARQGWIEAPYTAVPCKPIMERVVKAFCTDPRLNVHVIGGLKQENPADVMRGEETQIAGFLALNDGWDGVLCLPGTHTKWVHVSAGEVISFQTFMTGEQFNLLSGASVLRHSVEGDGWEAAEFEQAVSDSLSRPEKLAAHLFNLRARDLLHGNAKNAARARLSGLLIGAELGAAKPFWLGQNIAILGADKLARAYADALGFQGIAATIADGERMTLAGLQSAYRQIKETV